MVGLNMCLHDILQDPNVVGAIGATLYSINSDREMSGTHTSQSDNKSNSRYETFDWCKE